MILSTSCAWVGGTSVHVDLLFLRFQAAIPVATKPMARFGVGTTSTGPTVPNGFKDIYKTSILLFN
jgi:hypothetical protein